MHASMGVPATMAYAAFAKLSSAELGFLKDAVEVIPGKLYFRREMCFPCETAGLHFFSTDRDYTYEPFFRDFGPLNLSCIYRYCVMLKAKVRKACTPLGKLHMNKFSLGCSISPKSSI